MSSKKTKRLAAVLSLLSLMLLCLGLVACTLKTTYKVTLDYNADQGTVALSPQAENNEYEDGTELTVTVTAEENYEIEAFTVSTDAEAQLDGAGKYTLTVTADTTITVTFKATEPVVEKYSITKNTPENGEIEISPAAGEDGKYEKDAEITVTLKPAQGYEVDTFTVGGEDKKGDLNENVYKFNIAADTEINATFKASEPVVEKYSITKNTPENGEIEISPAAGEDDKYEKDAEITVTLKPAQGYEVDTFTVGGADKKGDLNENVYQFNIAADTEINATFKAKQFSVTTTFEAEQGSITLSPEATDNKYAYGTTVTVTVTAEENYEIEAFTVSTDAEAQLDGEGKYTLTVTADAAISATFKVKEIPVSSISLSAQTLELEVGREDQAKGTLTATIQPDNATTKVVDWSVQPASGTVSISAEGNTLTITPEATGSAVITAKIGNASATCTVSVSQHQHALEGQTATTEIKDADEHYLVCECGYKEAKSHSKALTYDQDDAEAGHYNACSVCGWKEDSKTSHTLTPQITTSNATHNLVCECGYSKEEAHTYNEQGSTFLTDGIKTDDESHFIECYVCHKHMSEGQHRFAYTPMDNGTHKVTCSGTISGTKVECPYDKIVNCEGTKLTYDDKVDPHNHYTLCDDCEGKFNAQPHKATEHGKCVCEKEMAEHTHTDQAVNGFYDGICDSCGEPLEDVWDWDAATGTIKNYKGNYQKVIVPSEIKDVAVITFAAGASGDKGFRGNTTITDIIIPASITSLPSQTFNGCINLASAVILANITELPSNCFSSCEKLTTLVLSASITAINKGAFGLTSGAVKSPLETIYYLGTKEAWDQLKAKVDSDDGKAKPVVDGVSNVYIFSTTKELGKWHWKDGAENMIPELWN